MILMMHCGYFDTTRNAITLVRNKIQIQLNKVCHKVSLCENFIHSIVVEQSISYEITKKYRTENVSFYPKYCLKLTYSVVASTCMLITMHSVNRKITGE